MAVFAPSGLLMSRQILVDRPYAGWLHGSAGLIAETGRRLDQLELTVGVVGPASLAEQTQKRIHEIVNADEPRGRNTQLKNEPGVSSLVKGLAFSRYSVEIVFFIATHPCVLNN
jgi:hypothetical protein